MIVFILYLGRAWQCIKGDCTPVPYEVVAFMAQTGILELIGELLGIAVYIRKRKKRD